MRKGGVWRFLAGPGNTCVVLRHTVGGFRKLHASTKASEGACAANNPLVSTQNHPQCCHKHPRALRRRLGRPGRPQVAQKKMALFHEFTHFWRVMGSEICESALEPKVCQGCYCAEMTRAALCSIFPEVGGVSQWPLTHYFPKECLQLLRTSSSNFQRK